MTRPLPPTPPAETLLSAVMYLMTKHAQTRCPMLRRAVAEHLRWLAGHPSPEVSAAQRDVLAGLARQWEVLDDATNVHSPRGSQNYALASGRLQ